MPDFASLATQVSTACVDTLGDEITLYAGGRPAQTIKAFPKSVNPMISGFAETQHIHRGVLLEIIAADQPAAKGDRVLHGGAFYTIRSVRAIDAGQQCWQLDCVPS